MDVKPQAGEGVPTRAALTNHKGVNPGPLQEIFLPIHWVSKYLLFPVYYNLFFQKLKRYKKEKVEYFSTFQSFKK